MSSDNSGTNDKPVDGPPSRPITKTPMFTAMHSSRYERQDLIKNINEAENTNLICYVGSPQSEINRDDIIGFVDMLHNIDEGAPIDLLLHTCGGDVDACEMLVKLVLAKVGTARFRVIVPALAKSAGTLMALGANTIIMSDTSELGMIDPQFQMRDSQGNEFSHSVIGYLEAFDEYSQALRTDPKDPVALLMLDSFDGKVVKKFRGIRDRVRIFAEDLLKRQGLESSRISSELLSSSRWKTHGQPIRHADATQLKLPVEYMPGSDIRWQYYWKLYCLQRLEIGEDKKIFESSYVSQTMKD